MGIGKSHCSFLFYSKTLGVSFRETLTLGRMHLYASREEITNAIDKYKTNEKEIRDVMFKDEYSEPFFEILGAQRLESMDFSAYENASVIHDLNQPIPGELKNKFSAVFDGGTLEHIFNFPVAIKSCMNALKVGGHYIGITPANNCMGHGFYQFSPELLFRIFSDDNGFRVNKMLLHIHANDEDHWYEVSDPKIVNSRVVLMNNYPVSIMVIAEKMTEKNVFESTPQQLDYVNTWNAHSSLKENKIQKNESKFKYLYRKVFPKRIKIILKNIHNLIFVEKIRDPFMGEFNPDHFKKTVI